jgi:predicted ATP-dependent endonuclease of OLD family
MCNKTMLRAQSITMYINKLAIRNYKNFRSSNFYFVKNSVNTIIGENASGKTNLFNAMRLILDDSLPMNSKFYLMKIFIVA